MNGSLTLQTTGLTISQREIAIACILPSLARSQSSGVGLRLRGAVEMVDLESAEDCNWEHKCLVRCGKTATELHMRSHTLSRSKAPETE